MYHLHRPANSSPRSLRTALLFVITGLTIAGMSLVSAFALESAPTAPTVIINEVKSGGSNTVPAEYVTLYNASDQDISLNGWQLEYAKSSLASANCATSEWKPAGGSAVTTATLSGNLAAHSVSQAFSLSINNDVAGSVHVIDSNHTVADLVGWGGDAAPAACKEASQAPLLTSNKSLIRYLNCTSSKPVDSNNNAEDFMLSSMPTPGLMNTVQLPSCLPTPNPEDEAAPAASCQHVSISEVLPNPAGTDSGHEYIELHNSTTTTSNISGCSLQTSANSKTFSLAGIVLGPDEYLIISDTESGLTLPNANGGTIWLLDAEHELQTITYPSDMEDDTVWAEADGLWAISFSATPGAANILTLTKPCPDGQIRSSETNRCVNIGDTNDSNQLTPCDPGQERNPETNRCRTIIASTAGSCPAGQTRNPETNRCRASATTASATATACKAGQERNPETNRCRAVTSTTTAKACPAGQERNPDTNRCRKIVAATSGHNGGGLDSVKDTATGSVQHNKPYWLIAALALIAAIGYAVYEWRQEIKLFWQNLKTRSWSVTYK